MKAQQVAPDRDADYMKKIGFDEIGYGRKYETMVFHAGEACSSKECNCGLPELADASELDMLGYNTAGEARKGHMKLCQKWSKK